MQGRKAYGSAMQAADSQAACLRLAEYNQQDEEAEAMQISLEEVRKVVAAYHQSRQAATPPLEPVPEAVQVSEEENLRLAQEIARELSATPDIRTERVAELKRCFDMGEYSISAEMVTSAIIRRMLADRIR